MKRLRLGQETGLTCTQKQTLPKTGFSILLFTCLHVLVVVYEAGAGCTNLTQY
uniref:Uncharacterized protein n=1 Tax=Brassica campestris TaxID=3711 RepID=A0A3P6DLY6_BRACM|nr:unnamed protein product [Brassica rapa]